MTEKVLNSIALVGGRQLAGRKNYFTRVVKFLRARKKEILLETTVAKILGTKAARDSEIREADLILVTIILQLPIGWGGYDEVRAIVCY